MKTLKQKIIELSEESKLLFAKSSTNEEKDYLRGKINGLKMALNMLQEMDSQAEEKNERK
ncbi:MAG: hypothetical protein HQM10_06500 [Candidatus Riflebacteria bacterium]|nr:hypothetical protein [Candidatus Riflebacteria bacterium]